MYFNPRLREGGDIDAKAKVCPHCQFQSTPPRRRRHNRIKSREEIQNFNPRLREGGDCMASQSSLLLLISIHASAKEATRQFPKKLISPQFQSTPPRRRRREMSELIKGTIQISIHASAKEATTFSHALHLPKVISIHASAKEATLCRNGYWQKKKFQSTPPRRRRQHRY